MSIEQQLDDINANLRKIAELLTPDKSLATAAAKPAAAPATKAVEIRKPPTATKPAPKEEVAEASAEEITVADVQKATTTLLTKRGRDATVKLLASFNATKATEIEAGDRAKFLADVKTLMAAA